MKTGSLWSPSAGFRKHWKHLRTINPVDSPFTAVQLRTTTAKRYKKVENADGSREEFSQAKRPVAMRRGGQRIQLREQGAR